MKIHEYQAKEIFSRFGVAIPKGMPAFSAEEALTACDYIGFPCVIKAQIHAGGRGKGGGIRLVHNQDEARQNIEELLTRPLVTVQTGAAGKKVTRLLIEQSVQISREFYVGITIDRSRARQVLMVSQEGGVEIENVARTHPEAIAKMYALPGFGLQNYQFRQAASILGLTGEAYKKALKLFGSLYNVFRRTDAALVEVNPLVLTADGNLVALDAKLNFDDNALYRHADYQNLRDISEEDPDEVEAAKQGLNYIRLTGNVGCMVNGAGLAMATMDIIKHFGGEPANFLDVGGVASASTIASGFRILLADPHVKAVLVNIFGGIVRCDRVATGIVEALKTIELKVPLVIRLEGTNAIIARQYLAQTGLPFAVATDFADAARKVVKAVQGC